MKLFLQEWKKIFRPLPLLILVLLTVPFSYITCYQSYSWLNTLHMPSDYYTLAADLREIVGEPVTFESYRDGVETLRKRVEQHLEENIRKHADIFAPVGITDYESYQKMQAKLFFASLTPQELESFRSGESVGEYPFDPKADYSLTPAEEAYAMVGKNSDDIFDGPGSYLDYDSYKLEFINGSMASAFTNYEEFKQIFQERESLFGLNAAAREHVMQLLQSDDYMGILPENGFLPQTTNTFFCLAVLILMTISILFAPILTKDTMSGVLALQTASKIGRKSLRIQLLAMLSAGLLIAAVELGITFAAYLPGIWQRFLDAGLHSFLNRYSFFWFTGTFGQWLFCCAGLVIALTLAATLCIFMLSKLCKNYITLLIGLIPTLAALVGIGYFVLLFPFAIVSENQTFYHILPLPFGELYICAALLLLTTVATLLLLKQKKRAELL